MNSKEKYNKVKNSLVLTDHAKDNLMGFRDYKNKRSKVKLSEVIACLVWGQLGFSGKGRYKSTHYGLSLEVIYKLDKSDPDNVKYVIITYYPIRKNKYRNKVDVVFDRILKENKNNS